jgi:hypothetical protein
MARVFHVARRHLVGFVLGALFFGGTAYATGTIGSAGITNDSLTGVDIKGHAATKTSKFEDGSLTGDDIKNGSVTGADVRESSLARVPQAANAGTLDGVDSTQFQRTGSEEWHLLPLHPPIDSSGPTPCPWGNYNGGFAPAGYFRDRDGIVHLRGLVQASDGAFGSCTGSLSDRTITDSNGLPPGYRPEYQTLFTNSSNDKPGRVDVGTGGAIFIEPNYPTMTDAKAWVQLDGLTFRCWPSGQDGCP